MSTRLRTAREGAGLTQKQIAMTLGLALKTVNNYENPNYTGARKPIVVRAWAELCDRRFEEIWGTARRPLARSGWSSQTPALALTG